MPKFVQKKRGTVAPGWAFDPKRDRAVPDEVARSEWLRNFVPRGRNRRRKPTPRGVSQESARASCKFSERKNRALSSIPLRLSCELPATPGCPDQ